MLFNSLNFIAFFLVVTTSYFLLPHRYRWFLLLMSSCYFYMVFVPVYILILGFTIVVDYFAGRLLESSKDKKRKWFLIASLVANIGVLAFFKYYNFLNENLTLLLKNFNIGNPIPYLSILLPIGLSFHTFQAMSYTIEVYRGHQKAERHFGIYALYVMFYPQLVAGPIERPQNMLHQFREEHYFDFDRLTEGLRMMLWGYFKKVVIADRLALYVDPVYNNPHAYTGSTFILATFFFAFQIYCDFSGYSDIAIGSAHIMGFKLMQNFKLPYFSNSIGTFWKRWHISLSSWFSDYVYIPLGGNRVKFLRWVFNVLTVFTISGLWHGANWTYIIWGALHGFYYLLERSVKKLLHFIFGDFELKSVFRVIPVILTFTMVSFAMIFFRSKDLDTAWYIISGIFSNPVSQIYMGNSQFVTFLSVLSLLFLFFVEYLQYKGLVTLYFSESKVTRPVRWAAYIFMLFSISMLGIGGNSFIYFQF
ncbi:MAG: MBOAT family O-acyltransferase [Bacteroidota bacterium]|nr:MBOAT family O-acyltransferase [Bacteroidota bacterium]